jgi:outer membrane lipoprotein-sorting protein
MRFLLNITVILFLAIPALHAAPGNKQYTIDEVAKQLQQRTGSKILSADVVQGKSGKQYRFKLEKDGRIKVMLMNPDGTRAKRK